MCTVLFVSISQVIGCEDRLRNDLYCVEWGVILYSNQFFGGLTAQIVGLGLRAGGHPALSLRSFNGVGRMGKVQGPRVSGKIFKIIFQLH